MIIVVVRPVRPYADLSGVVTKEILRRGWVEDGDGERYEVQFAVNLTATEEATVRRRLTTANDVEETLQERASIAYADLLAFENQASPTNAQTLAVVRLLCRVVRGLIRLQLRDLTSAD